MEKQGMINCPNCNKRTFANNDKCIYCKHIIKNQQHKFNKEIYNYIFIKYNESKNKPAIIKNAMEKFGLKIDEAKEIVDYISHQIYYEEETGKKVDLQKRRDEPMENLPTNGIDYSKYKSNSNSSYVARKKCGPLKLAMCVILFVILSFISGMEIVSLEIRCIGIILSIALFIKTFSQYEVPLNQHTFVFSIFSYFIHHFVPKLIVIILLMLILVIVVIYVGLYITGVVFVTVLLGIVLVITLWIKLDKLGKSAIEFTVDYGIIRCVCKKYNSYKYRDLNYRLSSARRNEYYDILYIRKIKETINSIIIYGDIQKKVEYYSKYGHMPTNSFEIKVDELRVSKNFKNNRNLIKSLKIREYEFNKMKEK